MMPIRHVTDREELNRFCRFAVIGVANTFVHFAVVIALVEWLRVYPVWANGIAFICANLFSFWANSRWSFRRAITRVLYARFLSVSLLSLLVTLGVTAVGEWLGFHYLVSVCLTMIALPVVTYFAHRYWTYR